MNNELISALEALEKEKKISKDIILDGESAHVGNHHALVQLTKARQFMRHHMFHSGILQTNGIDHAITATLSNTR